MKSVWSNGKWSKTQYIKINDDSKVISKKYIGIREKINLREQLQITLSTQKYCKVLTLKHSYLKIEVNLSTQKKLTEISIYWTFWPCIFFFIFDMCKRSRYLNFLCLVALHKEHNRFRSCLPCVATRNRIRFPIFLETKQSRKAESLYKKCDICLQLMTPLSV